MSTSAPGWMTTPSGRVALMSTSMFFIFGASTVLARVQAHPFVRNADLPAAITGLAVALVLTITYGLVTRAPSARIVTVTILAIVVLCLVGAALWNGFVDIFSQTEAVSEAIYILGASVVPLAVAHGWAMAVDEFDLSAGVRALPVVAAVSTTGSLSARLLVTQTEIYQVGGASWLLLLAAGLFAAGLGTQWVMAGNRVERSEPIARQHTRYLFMIGAFLFLATFASQMWQSIQEIGWLELGASGEFRSTVGSLKLWAGGGIAILLQLFVVGRLFRARRTTIVSLATVPLGVLAGIAVVYGCMRVWSTPAGVGDAVAPLLLSAGAGILIAALENVVLTGVAILYLMTSRAARYRVLVPMLLWIPGPANALSDLAKRVDPISVPMLWLYAPVLGALAWLAVAILVGRRFTEATK